MAHTHSRLEDAKQRRGKLVFPLYGVCFQGKVREKSARDFHTPYPRSGPYSTAQDWGQAQGESMAPTRPRLACLMKHRGKLVFPHYDTRCLAQGEAISSTHSRQEHLLKRRGKLVFPY